MPGSSVQFATSTWRLELTAGGGSLARELFLVRFYPLTNNHDRAVCEILSMDFIPLPDSVALHEPVPYLGGPDYDNLGFIGYDRRQGWDVMALYKGDLEAARDDWASYERAWLKGIVVDSTDMQDHHFPLAAAFIQTWILFGIFYEVLKRPLLRHELSSEVSKDPFGNAALRKHVSVRQAFGEFLVQRHNLNQHLPYTCRCLREAAMVISNFLDIPSFPKDSVLFQSAFEALAMLIEEIWIALVAFYPQLQGEVPAFVRLDRPTEWLQEQRGWCPNLTRRVLTEHGNAGLYYASLVPNLVTEQPHDRCDRDLCVASNIDKQSYAVQHVAEYCHRFNTNCDHEKTNCLCEDIVVPSSSFRAAFKNGGFPLINFKGNHIEIVEYETGTSFTAISHPCCECTPALPNSGHLRLRRGKYEYG